MKRGGQVIYAGPLGHHSDLLIEYFQVSVLYLLTTATPQKTSIFLSFFAPSSSYIYIFQSIPGVTEIKDGQNPATWMLDVSSSMVEAHLGIDFATTYANSELYRYIFFDPNLYLQPYFLIFQIR